MGTGFIKAGWSGEDLPRVVIPTVIGEPENVAAEDSGNNGDSKPTKVVSKKIGNEAYANQSDHELHYPIQGGIVKDWDRMTELLGHIFTDKLDIDPKTATVLMTDSPMSKKKDK